VRILHLAPIPASGQSGFAASVVGLARAQAALQNQVGILTTVSPAFRTPDTAIDWLSSESNYPIGRLLGTGVWRKVREMNYDRPDVVHVHGTYIPMHFVLARRFQQQGIPVIHAPRGDLTRFAQRRSAIKKKIANALLVRNYLRSVRAVHALTIGERDEILQFSSDLPLVILPNGIDDSFPRREFAEPARLSNSALRLVFIGRLDVHIKGLDLLLNAIDLANTFKCHVELDLVGSYASPADHNWLTARHRRMKNPDAVSFLGQKSGQEKSTAAAQADIAVFPSRSEGMPMAVLESMALGLPCIVTPETRMAEVIQVSHGGWVTEGTVAGLLTAITTARQARVELPAIGRRGSDYVRENYQWARIASRSIEIYRTL
jgi:glycosyltransferase involved in cell wall biosynthesis